jgi:16S rRNA (adenine1518-N6/adenine1519-N6)-dimethyltransferase
VTLTGSEVRALLVSHGLRPSRALGQNFVVDPNTVRRIARLAAVGPGDRVVEIGAGLGSLTLALAETGASVTAVEVDRRLLPVLRDVVSGTGARVVAGDAMDLNWNELLSPAGESAGEAPAGGASGGEAPDGGSGVAEAAAGGVWVLVANLPYNVATPLVADLLDGVAAVGRMLVMVQREVGERLAAGVGDSAYGAVSVKVAYWATAAVVGRVPPTVFLPRPRVDSVLVAIRRRQAPAVDPAAVGAGELFALVRAGFAHRRKMLRGSLAGLVPASAWAVAGVAPDARAEDLDVLAWGRLTAAVADAGVAAGARGPGGPAPAASSTVDAGGRR